MKGWLRPIIEQESFIIAAAIEDVDHLYFAGQNAIGDDGNAFERQYSNAWLQIISCTALHRKRGKTFTAVKDAADQIPCNLRMTGFRNNPVIYVFKIFDCPGPQTDGQAFQMIDFARAAT